MASGIEGRGVYSMENLSEITQPRTAQPAPSQPAKAIYHGADHDNPNQHPHRPFPDPKTGALIIDPDIVLKAKQFDLTLSFFYNSRAGESREFGVDRGASFGFA
jgi:hypothetical protein